MAHHEKLSEVAVVTLEKVHKNELEEEMSEEAKMVSDYCFVRILTIPLFIVIYLLLLI